MPTRKKVDNGEQNHQKKSEKKQKHEANKPPKKVEGKKKTKRASPTLKNITFSLTTEYAVHLVRIFSCVVI